MLISISIYIFLSAAATESATPGREGIRPRGMYSTIQGKYYSVEFIFRLSSVACTAITPGRERLTVTLTLTLEMKFSITNDQVVLSF